MSIFVCFKEEVLNPVTQALSLQAFGEGRSVSLVATEPRGPPDLAWETWVGLRRCLLVEQEIVHPGRWTRMVGGGEHLGMAGRQITRCHQGLRPAGQGLWTLVGIVWELVIAW